MEGQLRPGLRVGDDIDDEEAAVRAVLKLTVVLEEDAAEEVVVVVTGANGVCTCLADESPFGCTFSTLTAELEKKVTEMKRAARSKLRVRNTDPMRSLW